MSEKKFFQFLNSLCFVTLASLVQVGRKVRDIHDRQGNQGKAFKVLRCWGQVTALPC